MKIQTFEDILAWQKAKELVLQIYKNFSVCKDFSFKNQIERASVSIMNNIAEGFERQTNKEFKNFLFIAKGSCAEVRSMVSIAVGLRYISTEQSAMLTKQCLEISKILSSFIKKL
jgi:four helix bundle protein